MLGVLSFAHTASAQEAPAAAASVGTDVVRLKNGGLFRGTINELVPGESVIIVTASGKTHELSMADVEYAGPIDKDPAGAATPPPTAPSVPERSATPSDSQKVEPYVTVQGQRAKVHFDSTPPGITFHRAASSAVAVGPGGAAIATGYERLCTAPCDVTLPAGTEVLGISRPGDRVARDAGQVMIPAGASRISGSFESRSGLRAAGWVIVAASVVGGAALFYASFSSGQDCYGSEPYRSCYDSPQVDIPLLVAGAATFAIGFPVGVVIGTRPDVPKVQVGSAARTPTADAPLHGLALSGRF